MSDEKWMSLRKKHITICRDCLNFMNCIEYSFLFIRSIENIFMTGARSVPFTVHRKAVSGAVEESDVEMKIRKKF